VAKVFGDEVLDVLRGVLEKMKGSLDGVERRSVRDDGEVGPLLKHLGRREWELIVACRHLLDSGAVENLGLEEELWYKGDCE
jgi:hypothetical protein